MHSHGCAVRRLPTVVAPLRQLALRQPIVTTPSQQLLPKYRHAAGWISRPPNSRVLAHPTPMGGEFFDHGCRHNSLPVQPFPPRQNRHSCIATANACQNSLCQNSPVWRIATFRTVTCPLLLTTYDISAAICVICPSPPAELDASDNPRSWSVPTPPPSPSIFRSASSSLDTDNRFSAAAFSARTSRVSTLAKNPNR
jgi:hypothetical protein